MIKTIITLIIVLLLVFLVYFFYLLSNKKNTLNTNKNTTFDELIQNNNLFKDGNDALKSHNYKDAVDLFNKSRDISKNPDELAQIDYKIALSQEFLLNKTDSITLFKKIANNLSYPAKTRSYSVLHMTRMLSDYPDETKDIKGILISTEPYNSIIGLDKSSPNVREKLYAYSLQIWPELLPAKTFLADLYSLNLFLRYNKKEISSEDLKNEQLKIEKLLDNLDTPITDFEKLEDEKLFLGNIYTERALAIGYIYATGDKKYGDPKPYFQKALDYSTLSKEGEARTRYLYAAYLSTTNSKETILGNASLKNEILETLKPIYSNESYTGTIRVRSIIAEKNNLVGYKNSIIRLANIDDNFKKFLISNGWRTSDF